MHMSRRALLSCTLTTAAVGIVRPATAAEQPAGPLLLPTPPTVSKLGFESRVEQFTLRNGLTFLVLRRDVAPVVAAHIHADVGAFQEVDGQTGLAHLLEHMAFKGTRRVGAKNWQQEAPLLDALDEVFYELRELKQQAGSSSANSQRMAQLSDKLKQLQAQADALVVPNAYGAMLSRAGAVGLNATTSQDATKYFMALPSNKLELWFAMEAERFRAPVFRELYSEKRVIEEERRMRVDDAPLGKFQQEFAMRALTNNYRRPVIGLEQDFDGLGRREVVDFFAKHYGPRSMTVALVGDVTTEQVQKLAEKYFGSWEGASGPTSPAAGQQSAAASSPVALSTSMTAGPAMLHLSAAGGFMEPAAAAAALHRGWPPPLSASGLMPGTCSDGATRSGAPCYADSSIGGPLVMLGFKRPPLTSPEGPTIQVISDLLAGSRTARLTGRLVLQQQLLRGVRFLPSYPGDKYDGMCLVAAVPQQGKQPEDAQALVMDELERFVSEGPTVEELARVQRSTRTSVLASALSSTSMASLLATYQGLTGSWRNLITELEFTASLKPDDVRTCAQRLLAPDNMFTGYVYKA